MANVLRSRAVTLIAAGAGAVLTVSISIVPFVRFAYRSPTAHTVLDTTAGCIALLAAYLVFGRFGRSKALSDLAITFALSLFGFINLFVSALGDVLAGPQRELLSTWSILMGRLLATTLLAVAAFLPDRRFTHKRVSGLWLLVSTLSTVAALAVLEAWVGSHLGRVIPPALSPEASGRPRIVGHAFVLVLQLISMGLFAVAAAAYTLKAERTSDELFKWFGAGAALGAFARLNYFLFPSLYSEYFYTGDVLRLGFYTLLLFGAAREIKAYWEGVAKLAIVDERRRLARDLHDGLGQELTFIWAESHRADGGGAERERLARVSSAAERALEEARLAVAALTSTDEEPLDVAIARAAHDVAHRYGVAIEEELEPYVLVPSSTTDAFVRIAREAVANAVRHGRANLVRISLTANRQGLCLRVQDNGTGFDRSSVRTTGFGLTSMEERIRSLRGELAIESTPGEGTVVSALLRSDVARHASTAIPASRMRIWRPLRRRRESNA